MKRGENSSKWFILSMLFVVFFFLIYSFGVSFKTGNVVGDGFIGISNCQELQDINNNLNADYELLNNIDCSDTINWHNGEGFEPLGSQSSFFRGSLLGDGNKISNLFINRSEDYVGLFSYLGSVAKVTNLVLEDSFLQGEYAVGSIAGLNEGEIINSSVKGEVKGDNCTGGLVGFGAIGSSAISSVFYGDLSGNISVGGLVGYNYGDISYSSVNGNINGSDDVGGIVGYNFFDSTSSNLSFRGNVTGKVTVGGIIGRADFSMHAVRPNQMIYKNLFFEGNVMGDVLVGGFFGFFPNQAKIDSSFFSGEVSGEVQVGGLIGSGNGVGVFVGSENVAGGLQIYLSNTIVIANVSGVELVGGLCGFAQGFDVTKVSFKGNVKGPTDVGGFIGFAVSPPNENDYILSTKISYSSFVGNVEGYNAGGFVGSGLLEISNSYVYGNIMGIATSGGFIGFSDHIDYYRIFGDSRIIKLGPKIKNSYFGGGKIINYRGLESGGLIGKTAAEVVITSSSYIDSTTSNLSSSTFGTSKISEEMYRKSTYSNWNFNSIWQIDEGSSYPFFTWQSEPFISLPEVLDFIPISTCLELQGIKDNLYASYKLVNNIDCSDTINWNEGKGFVPIAYRGYYSIFAGSFNGNGYIISGLFINRSGLGRRIDSPVALFSKVGESAEIKNVGLLNLTVLNSEYVYSTGGLIGQNNGNVSNSFVRGKVSGMNNVGGFVGDNRGIVLNSYFSGSIEGDNVVGGLVANDFFGGNISNSYWDVNVSGLTTSAGGVGKTTAEMKSSATYVNWDFNNVWEINSNLNEGYPFLLGAPFFISPDIEPPNEEHYKLEEEEKDDAEEDENHDGYVTLNEIEDLKNKWLNGLKDNMPIQKIAKAVHRWNKKDKMSRE
ncbi:hypothetical protein HN832_00585 [archaeon]|nr:hypothetical protein [archaeon]MBT4373882.1 hypothetical protein [archaeon]MBT4532404.1 hypothetical protein [archaeon]MBT7001785.1 hypothetical protein [archaeon]MBT7281890.1 hypothetical protein [archaeon]